MGFRGGRWRAAPYIHYTKSVMLSSPVAGKRSSSSAGMSWNASMHCSQMGLRAAGGEVEPAAPHGARAWCHGRYRDARVPATPLALLQSGQESDCPSHGQVRQVGLFVPASNQKGSFL